MNSNAGVGIGTQAIVQDVRELGANTSAFMDRISEDPGHVKSYFDHPSLEKYKFGCLRLFICRSIICIK